MAKSQGTLTPSLIEKIAAARRGELYTLFVDGDTVDDPFMCRETSEHIRSCLAINVAALSRACAAAVSGTVGLEPETVTKCFYGIAQMCDLLDVITDVHDNATYQCMKRHESLPMQ